MPRTPAPALTAPAFTANARRLLAAGLAVAVLLAIFASFMVIALAVEIRSQIPLVALGFALGGLVMTLAMGHALWTCVLLLTQPDPILTIGPQGIHDRRISAAPLPWDAIRWRRVTVSLKRKAADAVQFHLDAPHPVRLSARVLGLTNRLLGYPPYTVQAMGLDTTTDQITAACARYKPAEAP